MTKILDVYKIPRNYWNDRDYNGKYIETCHENSSVCIICECGEKIYTDHESEPRRCKCGIVYKVELLVKRYKPACPCPYCGFEQVEGIGCPNIDCVSKGYINET